MLGRDRRLARLARPWLCALLTMWASLVLAAAPRRVALADAGADPALTARLRAELMAAGFTVVEVDPWADVTPPRLVGTSLRSRSADAAIVVADGTIDVWIVEPQALPRAVLREVIRLPTDPKADPTVTLRAVESVRAELVTRAEPRPSGGFARTERSKTDEPEEVDARGPFSIDLAVGASASPGGSTAVPAFALGAAWLPFERVGIGALVVASPFASSVDAAEGTASLWPGWIGGGLVLVPTSPEARWTLRLEPGVCAAWLHMVGEAAAPFSSQSDTVVAMAGYLRAALGLRLSSLVTLEAGAAAAATIPRVVVSFADREVASWGRPVALGFVGIELSP